uniref:cytochrome c oxidase subunit III n=1 Tax=Pyura mirabilis TaxID=111863 RepID=UPI002551CB59|nr:cytochrome c oxidase subunit III [Pyura mirabilis]UPP55923.1 cytochrome c oxidase subunit III [Pyura mirabilis]
MSYRMSPFHLVDASPWPILGGGMALLVALGLVIWMHTSNFFFLFVALMMLLLVSFSWWRDVTREGCYLGFHGAMVQDGLRIGMVLFIISEVFFFLGFFWAFFHSGLAIIPDVGDSWPPKGILIMDPMSVPLLNTVVLLSSGLTVTYCHYSLLLNQQAGGILGLILTLGLGFFFTGLQLMEYMEAGFNISDSVYGSVFFMATGFHGFHVIVGSLFLSACLLRMVKGEFTDAQHVGLECAIWYWHFVDVVWIFLYISIYWWGSVGL